MKVTAIVTPDGKVTDCLVDGHSIGGAFSVGSHLILSNDKLPSVYAEIVVTDIEIRQQAADGTQPGQAGA